MWGKIKKKIKKKELRGFAEGMFLGGGGARPGGKLC